MVNFSISSVIALSALSGLSLASPAQHHQHKREAAAVEVTEYQTFYVTADGAAAPTAADPSVAAVVVTSTAAAIPAAPQAPASSDVAAAASAVAVQSNTIDVSKVAPTVAAATSAVATSPASNAGSSGAFGVTYSPYKIGGACKSAGEVKQDIAELSGFEVIRLYGTDCNQVANVYAAKSPSQKLFLGVFDMGSIPSEVSAIASGINNDWNCVHTVSIGNELVNSGQASPAQIGGYVAQGRSALKAAGYSGPVISVDTFIAVIEHPELCQYSDYMGVNAHAFFDGGIVAANAGEWALQQIQRVWTACSGSKSVLITESGWPWGGDSNGVAVPSPENQDAAVGALKSSIGDDVILYNAYNDLWRAPGYLAVERSWGIYGNGAGN